jgi:hypothetical protein
LSGAILVGASFASHKHDATGALINAGGMLAGNAIRSTAPVTHGSSGTLVGQASTLVGTTNRFHAFNASGVLAPSGAVLSGTASRSAHVAVTHSTIGTLLGTGAVFSASASSSGAADQSATDYYRHAAAAIMRRDSVGPNDALFMRIVRRRVR